MTDTTIPALPAEPTAAMNHLSGLNFADYHPQANPLGLDNDGHIVNVVPMLQGMVAVSRYTAEAAEVARAASSSLVNHLGQIDVVSGIADSIVLVEAISDHVITVSNNITNIGLVGTAIVNVNKVANAIGNIDTVAGIAGDIFVVSANIGAITQVASNIQALSVKANATLSNVAPADFLAKANEAGVGADADLSIQAAGVAQGQAATLNIVGASSVEVANGVATVVVGGSGGYARQIARGAIPISRRYY